MFVFNVVFCLEIPLFHIMTAEITFGNINGVDSAAIHITLQETPNVQVTSDFNIFIADGLKQRHQGGSSSTQPVESIDPTGTMGVCSCVKSVMWLIFRHTVVYIQIYYFLCQ